MVGARYFWFFKQRGWEGLEWNLCYLLWFLDTLLVIFNCLLPPAAKLFFFFFFVLEIFNYLLPTWPDGVINTKEEDHVLGWVDVHHLAKKSRTSSVFWCCFVLNYLFISVFQFTCIFNFHWNKVLSLLPIPITVWLTPVVETLMMLPVTTYGWRVWVLNASQLGDYS